MKVRERFYGPTSRNLSGKKKIFEIGPLAAEMTWLNQKGSTVVPKRFNHATQKL